MPKEGGTMISIQIAVVYGGSNDEEEGAPDPQKLKSSKAQMPSLIGLA